MYALTITQTGMAPLRTTLSRLRVAVDDISPTFPEMERLFRSIELSQFGSEGSAGDTGTWMPLSARYAAWKRRHFPGKSILRRTDRLFESLVRRGPGSYIDEKPKRLTIGTSVPYAAFHQTGRRRRPPIAITPAQAARFQAILHRYFQGVIRGALLRAA